MNLVCPECGEYNSVVFEQAAYVRRLMSLDAKGLVVYPGWSSDDVTIDNDDEPRFECEHCGFDTDKIDPFRPDSEQNRKRIAEENGEREWQVVFENRDDPKKTFEVEVDASDVETMISEGLVAVNAFLGLDPSDFQFRAVVRKSTSVD